MTRDGEDSPGAETEVGSGFDLGLESAESDLSTVEEMAGMLEQLDGAIDVAYGKIESGRVYDADNESVRIQWLKAFGYLVRTKKQVLEEFDRAEMVDEIRALQEQQAREQYR